MINSLYSVFLVTTMLNIALASYNVTNDTTITYNVDAIDCIQNKSIELPIEGYVYESIINCFYNLCNVTEYFLPIVDNYVEIF